MTDYRVTFLEKETAALTAHPFDGTPGDDQIVGENIFSLISTGSERGGFTQQFPPEAYPMETGSSSIARVIAVGKNVTDYKIGDLFFHYEHHTRYVKLNADDAIPIPAGYDPEQVIFGRYAAVSMTSIYHMTAKAADQIIVTGLGLVGAMCAAVLQCFGYVVYAVDTSPERRETARSMGVRLVGESLKDLGIPEKSCGALMECSGNENALHTAIAYLREGGEAFQVGVPWHKTSDWDAHTLLREIFYGYISLHSGFEWSIPRKSDDKNIHSNNGHLQMAMDLIAQGAITIPDTMYELRNPADCHAVYTEIAANRMNAACVMLDWRQFKEEK